MRRHLPGTKIANRACVRVVPLRALQLCAPPPGAFTQPLQPGSAALLVPVNLHKLFVSHSLIACVIISALDKRNVSYIFELLVLTLVEAKLIRRL